MLQVGVGCVVVSKPTPELSSGRVRLDQRHTAARNDIPSLWFLVRGSSNSVRELLIRKLQFGVQEETRWFCIAKLHNLGFLMRNDNCSFGPDFEHAWGYFEKRSCKEAFKDFK